MADNKWVDDSTNIGPVLRGKDGEILLRFTVGAERLNERLEGERLTLVPLGILEVEELSDGWVVRMRTSGRDRASIRVPASWIAEGPPPPGRPLTAAERKAFSVGFGKW